MAKVRGSPYLTVKDLPYLKAMDLPFRWGKRWVKGLPYGPCGLCAIPDLQRIGVESLKIVGREASPFKKLASVRMVRDIVNRTRAGAEKLTVIERAISLRGEPEHCHSGYMCYYKVDA